MLQILNESYVDVQYDEERYLIKVYWKSEMTSEEYRKAFSLAIDSAKTHRIDSYLSDIRNQKLVSPNDRKWFEEIAFPNAIKAGLKRAAVVFSGNVFKKYYLNNILAKSKKYKLPMKFFTTEEDALIWFDSFEKD